MRQFVEKMELNPDTLEVDLQLRLPGNCANHVEAAAGVEPANKGFADLCLTTWLRRHGGAENGIRTRDPQLGKLLLYQLSYFRSCPTTS